MCRTENIRWKRLPEKLGSDRRHFASAMKARARSSRPPWPRISGRACWIRFEAIFAWFGPKLSHNSANVKVADAFRRSKLSNWQNDRLANAYGMPKTALPDFWGQHIKEETMLKELQIIKKPPTRTYHQVLLNLFLICKPYTY